MKDSINEQLKRENTKGIILERILQGWMIGLGVTIAVAIVIMVIELSTHGVTHTYAFEF